MIVRDLGIATAYGYAKEKGYTGTEEEFAILMASYATVAEEAAQSATTAGNAATSASNSAQTATTKASEASASASNAATSASSAATSASNAASSASSASTSAQTATTKAGEASASATRAEEAADSINEPDTTLTIAGRAADAKATGDALASVDVDTVNNARQLLSEKYLLDEEPYLFRASGGEGADRVEECIVGGSVAWNQLQGVITSYITEGGDASSLNISISNGYINVSGTPSEDVYIDAYPAWYSIPANHVILISGEGTGNLRWGRVGGFRPFVVGTGAQITKHDSDFSGHPRIALLANNTYEGSLRFNTFDLTAMFGSTIADYIYSLEQATAGAGVAWFRKYFPADFYEYSAPTLRHVERVSQKEVVGWNQWDEETESGYINTGNGAETADSNKIRMKNYIPVLPNTKYYKKTAAQFWNVYFDENKNYIGYGNPSEGEFTTPANCHYIRSGFEISYGTTYKNDICISLSDPTKNGQYEPYRKNIYPLDSTLTLRGIPKLTDGKMWFDGDKYLPSGQVQRRYGIVDLGTLNWGYNSSDQRFYSQIYGWKEYTVSQAANAICSQYYSVSRNNLLSFDKCFSISTNVNSYINIRDSSYTDAATFKAAMSGVYLVYELATPTTEEATPYTALQTLDPNGTEEFVSTGIVPVGHYSKYLENLRSKIEGLPKDFSTLIAPTEETYKATRNYTVGSLLIVDNILYKVTSAIANGGNITPNTNVTATTLSAVIAAL